MEAYSSCLAIVVIVLVIAPTAAVMPASATVVPATVPAGTPGYKAVRGKIRQLDGKIDYKTFCQPFITDGGEDKNVCRVMDHPSVCFLVCKNKEIDGSKCEEVIKKELQTLNELKLAEIKTVDFDPEIVNKVRCGESESGNECTGFMETWIGDDIGTFKHVRNYISDDRVQGLIDEVKELTNPKEALSVTVTDLLKIKTFMSDPLKHQQICDLQGFFLKAGGFQVSDPTEIKETKEPEERCWPNSKDQDPTAQMVEAALTLMITDFERQLKKVIV